MSKVCMGRYEPENLKGLVCDVRMCGVCIMCVHIQVCVHVMVFVCLCIVCVYRCGGHVCMCVQIRGMCVYWCVCAKLWDYVCAWACMHVQIYVYRCV